MHGYAWGAKDWILSCIVRSLQAACLVSVLPQSHISALWAQALLFISALIPRHRGVRWERAGPGPCVCPAEFHNVEPLETQKRGASPLGQICNWKKNGSKRQVSMSCVRHLTTRFPLEGWGERRREIEGQGKVEVLQGGGLDGGDLCIRDKASGRRASRPLTILSNTPFSTSHAPKSRTNFIHCVN